MQPEVRKRVSSEGGKARAKALSPTRRSEIARRAALAKHAKRLGVTIQSLEESNGLPPQTR